MLYKGTILQNNRKMTISCKIPWLKHFGSYNIAVISKCVIIRCVLNPNTSGDMRFPTMWYGRPAKA